MIPQSQRLSKLWDRRDPGKPGLRDRHRLRHGHDPTTEPTLYKTAIGWKWRNPKFHKTEAKTTTRRIRTPCLNSDSGEMEDKYLFDGMQRINRHTGVDISQPSIG